MPRIDSPAGLEDLRRDILSGRDPDRPCITLCSGTACHATRSDEVAAALGLELEKQGLKQAVDLRRTGCHGFCEKGPIIVIYPEGTCYLKVKPGDVPEIVTMAFKEGKIVERLLYVDPTTGEKAVREDDIPFYRNQQRLVIGHNTRIDPKSLDDYLAVGGYRALARALFDMTPLQVIAEVKEARLRGRGGAGFPAGVKWEAARNAIGEPKYLVVNCDEGDPGAYMDRSLMEGNPFCVLEGLTIGAHAIGAREGYIYVRHEYPLAVENVTAAIAKAEEHGLLGKGILGSSLDFSAFVCGEETALLMSLEGKVGEPRPRPPFPATKGLWGKPTNINNVETWANVPLILDRGAAFFSSMGTEGSKGTKIFSLVGKVNNTGLVEVPMGVTLRDIVYRIGGGIPGGKRFKAVQTGGPAGGCIPESMLDMPVDFDELTRSGSMMGSGGMIVLDEDTCMVDFARYFLGFLTDESCGKCVPCREGVAQMLKILTRMTRGQGRKGDIDQLMDLSEVAGVASLCALGRSAPNPVLSTMRYFRDEYVAHVEEKRCPALSCKDLVSFHIDPGRCSACMICLRKCPAEAIDGGKNRIHVVIQEKCTSCGTCLEVCPARFDAVRKTSGVPVPSPIPEDRRTSVRKGKAT